MKNIIIKLVGLTSLVFFSALPSFDRFIWLRNHLQSGPFRTLDAGCGSGTFTFYAAKLGNDAVGISFDKRNNSTAQERAKLLGIQNAKFIEWDLRNLSELSNDIGLFDQIICFETPEELKMKINKFLQNEKTINEFKIEANKKVQLHTYSERGRAILEIYKRLKKCS